MNKLKQKVKKLEKKLFEGTGVYYYYIMASTFVIFFAFQSYGAILAAILFVGFYDIVVVNEKYKFMKDFIEMFL